ncbi:MAG: YebC/PmpR family DNA-binding transcriptional regulator [Gammaproteobacteria bacterium]|nr:YebC/PmpR family DNA-binding transcriptional regulator [Gammaproteobacteria bacterium]
MGRAHEVRAASMAKTNLAKSKLYSKYGKLIYMEARNGFDPNANLKLRALIDKAKKEQVPADVIKRNIDKAKGGTGENYSNVKYEAFGPAGSTFIIDCLSDNTNRTFTSVRSIASKSGAHLGTPGSVSYQYDYQGVLVLKGIDEEQVLEVLMEAELEPTDLYTNDDESLSVITQPSDLNPIKEALEKVEGVEVLSDEVLWQAKELVEVPEEDLEKVQRLLDRLNEDDDVSNVYHNVSNLPEEE